MQNKPYILVVKTFSKVAVAAALLFACAHARSDSRESIDECHKASKVALEGYSDFLERALSPHAKKMHGLVDTDEYWNANLGAPFVIHEILPEQALGCAREDCESLEGLSAPYRTYMFPVLFEGRIKLMMTVFFNPSTERLEIGSLGGGWLARELSQILKTWPAGKGSVELYFSPETGVWAFSVTSHPEPNLTMISPAQGTSEGYAELSPLASTARKIAFKIEESQGGTYR